MGRAPAKAKPLRRILLQPAIALILIICAIYLCAIVSSGVFRSLDESSSNSFYRSVTNRTSELRSTMTDAAGIAEVFSKNVSSLVYEKLEQSDEYDNILDMLEGSNEVRLETLNIVAEEIGDILNLRKVTGAFVCLDVLTNSGGESGERYSVYIRDDSVLASSYTEANLTLIQGPLSVLNGRDIMKYHHWSAAWSFEDEKSSNFFTKPIREAKKGNDISISALGYWSEIYTINNDSVRVITYSVPLITPEGEVFGVFGVELSASYIQRLLPHSELNFPRESFYLLSDFTSEGYAEHRIQSGEYAAKFLTTEQLRNAEKLPLYDNKLYEIDGGASDDKAITAIGNVNLYSISSPYYGEAYTLYGVVKESALYSNSRRLLTYLIYALAIALIIGVAGIVYFVSLVAKPIKRVVKHSQSYSGKSGEIFLGRTGMKEIDTLVVTIEDLSTDFLEFSRRVSEAITLTEVPIGIFEINRSNNTVYINKMIAQLFSMECEGEETFLSFDIWEPLINKIKAHKERNSENVYAFTQAGADTKWLRIKTALKGNSEYGIIIDVTTEVLERMHFELERDTDSLTGVLTRNAFFAQAIAKIQDTPDKMGAFIFSDIDNLKAVNEKFGHDVGNHYVIMAAETFKRFGVYGGIVGRLTSDEFVVFLYGYDSEEKLKRIINDVLGKATGKVYDSLAPSINNIQCSTGYSFYPRHGKGLDSLMRYSEFAMNEIKRTIKGGIREFSSESYSWSRNRADAGETLNAMLESGVMDYSFQPIVSTQNGKVYAYEALMRPGLAGIQTPQDVIDFARTQAKLYQIEHMTYFSTLAWIKENAYFVGEKKIFINSIPGMMLTTRDLQKLRDMFGEFIPLIVTEITADEQSDDEFISTKVGSMRKSRGEIAIDKFTDSVESDLLIMRTKPEYIKLEKKLITEIHENKKNQSTVREIAKKAHSINAMLIACCIESAEELEMLIMLGVDFVQGNYIGEPMSYLEDIPKSLTKEILRAKQRRNENLEK